ncbi:MAG: nitrilase-related carbon-nitrogen hydrolase [Pyrinomonadaceae bacterium]
MNVLCCQPNIVWENKHANHAAVREMLERAAPSAGTLVILPEMFATGFSMNVSNISDSSSRGNTALPGANGHGLRRLHDGRIGNQRRSG